MFQSMPGTARRSVLRRRARFAVGVLAAALSVTTAAHAERSTLSSDGSQNCAVTTSSAVACWGSFADSRAPDASAYSPTTPEFVPQAAPARSVATGSQAYQCAVRQDNTIGCWGAGWWVDEDYFPRTTIAPVDIVTDTNGTVINDFVDVAVNSLEGCGVRTIGLVVCWKPEGVAKSIPDTGTAVSITSANDGFCAVLMSRGVTCWHHGMSRANGTWGPRWPWTTETGARGFAVQNIDDAVTASGTCALLTDATVTCWSIAHYPQTGAEYLSYHDPVAVPGVADAVRLSSGPNHSCVVRRDGTVLCWGENTYGQLGTGDTAAHETPVVVLDLHAKATDVSVTDASTCARLVDSSIRCWGRSQLVGRADAGTDPVLAPTEPDGALRIASSTEPQPQLKLGAPVFDTPEIDTTSITLHWHPTGTLATVGFRLKANGQTVSLPASARSYTLSGLTPGTDYAITLTALDGEGQQSASADISYRTESAPQEYHGTYSVRGTTTIASLSRAPMPLSGSATLDAVEDSFTGGNVVFNDTQGRGTVIGIVPVTATVGFLSSGPGSASSAQPQTLTLRVRVKVKAVKAFGAIPLAGGNSCQTKELSTVALTAQNGFTPRSGGDLAATYAISNLNGCGLFGGLVTSLVASSGNPMQLTLTRR